MKTKQNKKLQENILLHNLLQLIPSLMQCFQKQTKEDTRGVGLMVVLCHRGGHKYALFNSKKQRNAFKTARTLSHSKIRKQ